MPEHLASEWDEQDPDPRERPEERAEMEEFAVTIIGNDWRERISRKDLVEFWIWHGGEQWRQKISFLKDWYQEREKILQEQSGEQIPENELRVLGGCIEPTEHLYELYQKFAKPASVEQNARSIEHGFDPDYTVLTYEDFVTFIEEWKVHDPAELYCKVQRWQMGYQEFREQLRKDIHAACDRVFSFLENRGKGERS